MSNRAYGFKFFGSLFVVVTGALLIYCSSIANGPDYDVSFSRDVPSALDAKTLGLAIRSVSNWQRWFFSMDEVKVVDGSGNPFSAKDQIAGLGELVRFSINPKRGPWSHFQVVARIIEYEPGRKIRLEVLSDTKNKLTQLFDHLQWQVELLPAPKPPYKTLIRGSAMAKTRNWRSRLFGRITERIMMNQVFYPDLLKLAELKDPVPPNPLPANQQ